MKIDQFTLGVGDRFAHQAKAQLQAFIHAAEAGAKVVPVWNKSHREHSIIGSEPNSVRTAADAAVASLGWDQAYHVDADHIGLGNVDLFMQASDFFTIDVADFIGQSATSDTIDAFVAKHPELIGQVEITGLETPLELTKETVERVATQFLLAVQEAGKVYRHILAAKGGDAFVPEISMDETDSPQKPDELLVILAAIADEGIPVRTIAPKFTGRFNKGVDYVGEVDQFEKEFNADICVIAHAIKTYGLPEDLKLSVHSGSDKFSIYGPIRRALQTHGAGLHLKTAGTTWLEEVIGLAEADGDGLVIAKEIYAEALANIDALCAPYATVIDIDRDALPSAETVQAWTSEQYVRALRHVQSDPLFNPSLRQLLHVGFKVAAKMGDRYTDALKKHEACVARNVTENLLERHIRPLFL
jgi:tagaturonate epimerase